MPARSAIVRVGLGVLLLATAGLKLYGLGFSSVPRVGWFSHPWVQVLAAEWELVLGGWLLSGARPRLSWLAALATFMAFAGVSGYLGWVGVASCGCLGAIKANPWWTFGVDVAAVALLAVSRPVAEVGAAAPLLRTAGVWVGSVALTCGLLVAVGSLFFGSVEAAVAKLRGESLSVTPYVDFGSGKPGETLEATATVTNYTDEPVRLIGGTSDCTCVTVEDFPLTIPPGERASFRVRLNVISNTGGQFTRAVTVRTDCPSRPVLQFRIGCRVEE
jgi:hypothetical protein